MFLVKSAWLQDSDKKDPSAVQHNTSQDNTLPPNSSASRISKEHQQDGVHFERICPWLATLEAEL